MVRQLCNETLDNENLPAADCLEIKTSHHYWLCTIYHQTIEVYLYAVAATKAEPVVTTMSKNQDNYRKAKK